MNRQLILQADAREIPLADESVQCAVTSPPYWGLRDYGHVGQMGLEPTLAEYLAAMVEVFREVRRVLRPDGTLWLNMGDGYDSGTRSKRSPQEKCQKHGYWNNPNINMRTQAGIGAKQLLMQPHRLAIALQDDGWYVRMDNVWAKPNPMPESVTDRPTKSHEYVFLLSKSERYFYDAEAVREPSQSGPSDIRKMLESLPQIGGKAKTLNDPFNKASSATNIGRNRAVGDPSGRNLRSVWTMATMPCREAHFATFPIDLPLRCIKAGTSEKGCCPTCAAPWRRVVERVLVPTAKAAKTCVVDERDHHADAQDQGSNRQKDGHMPGMRRADKTLHWLPTCKCPAHTPVPCVVLDPFGGAGTVALAAHELGRRSIIVERKHEYCLIAKKRLAAHRPRTAKVRRPRVPKPYQPELFAVGT